MRWSLNSERACEPAPFFALEDHSTNRTGNQYAEPRGVGRHASGCVRRGLIVTH